MCEQVVKIADFCQALHLTEGRISIHHTSVKVLRQLPIGESFTV